MIVEDKIRSIETLLRHLATSQVTVQEVKAVHAVIASLTQEAQDLNTGRENSTLRTREQLDTNKDRLTKFDQWVYETSDGIVAWTREELTRLCIKNSVTPPAKLKTSLQGNVHDLQKLLEPQQYSRLRLKRRASAISRGLTTSY